MLANPYSMADPPTGRRNDPEMVGYLAREFKKIERTLSGGTTLSPMPPPLATTSAGRPGEVRYDDTFLYICVATNTWKRVAFGEWVEP